MTTPNESLTPDPRAQALSQRNQQATSIIAAVRTQLQEFFKTYGIVGNRRRIMPLGNYAIYYGDFTYSSTYVTVRFDDASGQPYIELTGKSPVQEREDLAVHLRTAMNLTVTVPPEP